MSHTPGPWVYVPIPAWDNTHIVRDSSGHAICRVNFKNIEANARLIAAAPELKAENDRLRAVNAELLEALVELCGIVEWAIENKSTEDMDSFTLQPAQAAIAKARGDDNA